MKTSLLPEIDKRKEYSAGEVMTVAMKVFARKNRGKEET